MVVTGGKDSVQIKEQKKEKIGVNQNDLHSASSNQIPISNGPSFDQIATSNDIFVKHGCLVA